MQRPPITTGNDAARLTLATAGPRVNPGGDAAEALLSATTRLVDRNGIEWELTLRAGAEGKAFVAFLDVLGAAGAYALSHGFVLPATERTPPD